MKILSLIILTILPLFAVISMSCSSTKNLNRDVSNLNSVYKKSVDRSSLDEVLTESSSAILKPSKAFLLRDNDSSFASKIYTIRKARSAPGVKSLKLIYYIYSDDETSSFMSEELIAAARDGVQVQLLVDYIFNFPNLQHFKMLEAESRKSNRTSGSITVSFYNMPSLKLQAFAEYMVSDCPGDSTRDSQCSKEKMKIINNKLNQSQGKRVLNGLTDNAKMFLAGLFAQNGSLIKMSLGELDLASLQSGPEITTAERKSLLDFVKVLFNLKVRKRYVSAGLKYLIAMSLYGEKLKPIENNIDSFIPASLLAGKELAHFTDYTHHKFLLANDSYLQIGGRNIENSYHLSKDDLVKKYLFRDTDIWFDISKDKPSQSRLAASFSRIWFHPATVLINEIDQHASVDTLNLVNQKLNANAILPFDKHNKNLKRFIDYKKNQLKSPDLVSIYSDPLSIKELDFQNDGVYQISTNVINASFHYVENIKPTRGNQQVYGSEVFREKEFGKNIHRVWTKAIEEQCKKNNNLAKKPIILHNAYYSPTANLLRTMGQQLNGQSNYNSCSNIHYKVVTNSVHTTDLLPINLIGRRQMYELYNSVTTPNKNKLKFYEYNPISTSLPHADKKIKSLHSKVLVVDNDIYIGSANADMRSLMMDTNNGVYIRNHSPLANNYRNYINGLETRGVINPEGDSFYKKSEKEILNNDKLVFAAMASKFGLNERLSGPQLSAFEKIIFNVLSATSKQSKNLLQFNLKTPMGTDISDDFFQFDNNFKVF